MELERIIAAADESEAGRQAVRTAVEIGRRSSGSLTVLHVIAAQAVPTLARVARGEEFLAIDDDNMSTERIRRWVEEWVVPAKEVPHFQLSVAYGVPGIEICRFAEDSRADLIVLGRKDHCERARLLLGDTADAVARRSRVPALFVPSEGTQLSRILVAMDASPRGISVLEHACDFARIVGASVQVVTVEAAQFRQPLPATAPAMGGKASIQSRVSEALIRRGLPNSMLTTRRGSVADEVLAEVAESRCDVLAIGHHRGEPSWTVQAGSTAQRLSHAAPCAVLTIPL